MAVSNANENNDPGPHFSIAQLIFECEYLRTEYFKHIYSILLI